MKTRMLKIYKELYRLPQNKIYFSELFDITTKSVENTMKKYDNDIVYDRKLGKYRFRTLLPSLIPVETFFLIFKDSVANELIKKDILTISTLLSHNSESLVRLIVTEHFSPLVKHIIMSHIAIGHNCTLKITYTSIKKPTETKYIRPHKITSTGYIYYLFASYDKRNKNSIGEFRSFAFNSISDMTAVEYLKDEHFSIDGKGNAYGMIDRDKSVLLKLKPFAASFFKRERQFEREEFEFVSEDINGDVLLKMYYNNLDEIVYLLQQWMPLIEVEEESLEKKDVYRLIKNHCKELLGDFMEEQ